MYDIVRVPNYHHKQTEIAISTCFVNIYEAGGGLVSSNDYDQVYLVTRFYDADNRLVDLIEEKLINTSEEVG